MSQTPHDQRPLPSMSTIMETPSTPSSHGTKPSQRQRTPVDEPPLRSQQQPNPRHPPRASAADRAAERRLLWKLDLIILPTFLLILFLSFLDRISMSNGKSMGLMDDLSLTNKKYNIAYFICFATLVIFGVPSTLLLCKSQRPSWYLGGLMVCWGVINLTAGFVHTFHELVASRFLLGIFEAGLQPGIIYVASLYYTRYEFQKRLSFLFCGNLAASAFGPLLAYAIGKGIAGSQTVNPKNSTTNAVSSIAPNGFKGWRWVFIVEGSITAAVGLLACFFIVDEPTRCRFLSAEERRVVQRRAMKNQNNGGDDATNAFCMDHLDGRALWRSVANYKVWLGTLVAIGMGTTAHSTAMFMSSILHDFGYKSRDVQVHTLPVYAVAAVFMVGVGYLSDRLRLRYVWIMAATIVATIGYCMLLDETWMNRESKYGASFLIAIGGYSALPLAFGWLVENLAGRWKRAIGIGIQGSLGNMAGVVASNIYRRYESPAYLTGYGVALGFLWMGALAATIMAYLMWDENRRRDEGGRASRLRCPPEEVINLGDDHPDFRYTI